MTSLLDSDNQVTTKAPSTHSDSQTTSVPVFFHHARLPRIDIPKFSGSPADWLSFKDLFSSLILANPTLTSVEKLQYLKTSLTGSASHLLKNTTLTADNFQKAWDALIAFYENKRLLVNAALHSLVTLKRMTKESASEMEQLYTSIMQIYRTLETLHRPVETWDDFLVFIATQRLDSESVKTWEHHLGSSKEPPTWKQFSEFLITRLLSLQAFEKSRTGKLTFQSSVKSHFQGKANENNPSNSNSCKICSANHYVTKCPQYNSKTIQQRLAIIAKHHLCYNCLGSHRASACRITKRCQKCGHKHHTTIHQSKENKSDPGTKNGESSSTGSKINEANVLHAARQTTMISSVFLATAQVEIVAPNGETTQARVLIDPGSEISLISEQLAQLLRLPRTQSCISLVGIGGKKSNKTRGIVSFKIRPHFSYTPECFMTAYILPKLTDTIPSCNLEKRNWPHLKGLQLADKEFTSSKSIDIIIGADFYAHIIERGLVKGDENSPIAQETKLGWIISGPSGSSMTLNKRQGYHVSLNRELHDLISRFWEFEEIPTTSSSILPVEAQDCEQHFMATHSRDDEGRYIVRLPFRQSEKNLGDSRLKAIRTINSLSKRLNQDTAYSQLYSAFLEEYESLNHMRRVPDDEPEPPLSFYLPHHGVIRENSLTTKLRVVFNGSSISSTGLSLNDLLHTGEKLQRDLFDVLIWFRQFRYVFATDVEKMYRQIKVHPADWNFQRILWLDQSHNIVTYQLTTVTYGLACAPFLALRTLNQLIIDEGTNFPLAIPVLQHGRYVDDLFGGSDSIQHARDIAKQVNQL
ncbi:gag-pol polyprotein precursor, partial [Lasius niger]